MSIFGYSKELAPIFNYKRQPSEMKPSAYNKHIETYKKHIPELLRLAVDIGVLQMTDDPDGAPRSLAPAHAWNVLAILGQQHLSSLMSLFAAEDNKVIGLYLPRALARFEIESVLRVIEECHHQDSFSDSGFAVAVLAVLILAERKKKNKQIAVKFLRTEIVMSEDNPEVYNAYLARALTILEPKSTAEIVMNLFEKGDINQDIYNLKQFGDDLSQYLDYNPDCDTETDVADIIDRAIITRACQIEKEAEQMKQISRQMSEAFQVFNQAVQAPVPDHYLKLECFNPERPLHKLMLLFFFKDKREDDVPGIISQINRIYRNPLFTALRDILRLKIVEELAAGNRDYLRTMLHLATLELDKAAGAGGAGGAGGAESSTETNDEHRLFQEQHYLMMMTADFLSSMVGSDGEAAAADWQMVTTLALFNLCERIEAADPFYHSEQVAKAEIKDIYDKIYAGDFEDVEQMFAYAAKPVEGDRPVMVAFLIVYLMETLVTFHKLQELPNFREDTGMDFPEFIDFPGEDDFSAE